jgi:hypothetical protein
LEQRFITIDNLLDEEDVDPFMDDEIESVMTVSINETSKSHMSSVYNLIVARLPTSLDDSQEMSDDDTISSLFPEVVEFVMDLGVELEDSITDMLAIDSDDHPVVPMNLQVIMGSNDPSNQSKQTLTCLQLMTTSDASATVLPYDRGPVKVLTVCTGSLKSLPFDHGPASPNLSVLLQAVPRLVFEVMKACCLLHLEFISYFVLVLRALSALTVEQAFCGLSPELALFSLRQDDLKTSEESLRIIPIFFQRMCFSFSDLCFDKDFKLMGSDKICTALRSYRSIVCPSVSPLSLPLTESSNSEKNVHVWSWFFPLLRSHS